MPNIGHSDERRLWQALTSIGAAVGDGNNDVFLRPCHGDRAWEGVQRCNLFVVEG